MTEGCGEYQWVASTGDGRVMASGVEHDKGRAVALANDRGECAPTAATRALELPSGSMASRVGTAAFWT
jgi:hypothetical protein